jgi:Ca2+-binding RTX toxin-like protein
LSSGNDTCDGGAGFDGVGFNVGGTLSCLINLDTKAITLGTQILQKNLLFSAAAGMSSTIKNFERATGGGGDDFIAGTSAANLLSGNSGNDVLYGDLGADRFQDNNGDDTYVYLTTKDSGMTEATRDVISFFAGAGGGDKIDLHGIDADTKTKDNQDFTWLNDNVNFTKVAGELRAVFRGNDTVVQGDVNGDGRADFEITVTGIQFLNANDFVV